MKQDCKKKAVSGLQALIDCYITSIISYNPIIPIVSIFFSIILRYPPI